MTSDFAFVLGTGRCGSTLVHEVLARHPDVGFVSNIEDRFPVPASPGYDGTTTSTGSCPSSSRGRAGLRFAPSEGYRALDREVSPVLSTPFRDLLAEDVTPWLSARTLRFFQERARIQDKPLFLHKFTGWPRSGFLQRILPDARFVNVIRDGRAVANSFLQMPWWRGLPRARRVGLGTAPRGVREDLGGVGPLVRRPRRSGVADPDGGVRGGASRAFPTSSGWTCATRTSSPSPGQPWVSILDFLELEWTPRVRGRVPQVPVRPVTQRRVPH